MNLLDSPRTRITICGFVLLIIFFIMGVKAFREQIKLGAEHENAVQRQSIRRIRLPAKRGKILTADLQVLAESTVSYDVNFYFEEMRQPGRPGKTLTYAKQIYAELTELLGRNSEVSAEDIERHIFNRAGLPLTVFSNLSDREIAIVFQFAENHIGIEVIPNALRFYPHFDLAAHIIGYAQRQDPSKAGDRKEFFYYQSDLVGKTGLEMYCDEFEELRGLRGEPGQEVVRVDNFGFIREVMDENEGLENGNNVILTIDSRAQTIVENLLRGSVGAMVVLNADSGEVLAMTSQPSYNLNLFSPFIGSIRYNSLVSDPDKPLFNRALYGSYMPGSIIKPLACLAFLENGVDPYEELFCDGSSKILGTTIRCASYRSGGHGNVNLFTALEKSCNDYLIEHAVAIGLEEIAKQYQAAGVGRPTNFELGGVSGLLPNEQTLKDRQKRNWTSVDTAFASIGQGIIELSPLQAAIYAGALANGGNVMTPYLVKKVVDDEGKTLREFTPKVKNRLAASTKNIELVKEGMFEVINATRGTGRKAKNSAITLYGKTGTAEVGRRPNLKNNSFFICFGEHNGITYSVFVLQENGAGGGSDCAPLVAEFFEQYLN